MKIKENVYEKDNGTFETKGVIETTPDDGFVHQADIHDVGQGDYGKYQKGYSKSVTYATNDPRITRPFVYSFCAVFFIIGIILLVSKTWFLGIMFTFISVFGFFRARKDINKIEKEIKERGENNNEKN